MKCPRCGALIQLGQTQCLKCGSKFKTQPCPHCGSSVLANLPECPRCHKKLADHKALKPQSSERSRPAAPRQPLTKRWWFWAACAVFTIGLVSSIASSVSAKISESRAARPPVPIPPVTSQAPPASSFAPSQTASDPSSPPSQTPEETNVFLRSPVEIGDVMNGIKTEKLGEWAGIHVQKADAKAASMDDFKTFVNTRVDKSGFNWWAIIFEDGTGITFPASQSAAASYGEVDHEGAVVSGIGDIILDPASGSYTYTPRKNAASNSASGSAGSASSASSSGNNNFNTYDNPQQQNTSADYVLNTHTQKFHYPSCNDVKKIAQKNYSTLSGSRDDAISSGYSPCGHCNP